MAAEERLGGVEGAYVEPPVQTPAATLADDAPAVGGAPADAPTVEGVSPRVQSRLGGWLAQIRLALAYGCCVGKERTVKTDATLATAVKKQLDGLDNTMQHTRNSRKRHIRRDRLAEDGADGGSNEDEGTDGDRAAPRPSKTQASVATVGTLATAVKDQLDKGIRVGRRRKRRTQPEEEDASDSEEGTVETRATGQPSATAYLLGQVDQLQEETRQRQSHMLDAAALAALPAESQEQPEQLAPHAPSEVTLTTEGSLETLPTALKGRLEQGIKGLHTRKNRQGEAEDSEEQSAAARPPHAKSEFTLATDVSLDTLPTVVQTRLEQGMKGLHTRRHRPGDIEEEEDDEDENKNVDGAAATTK